MKVFLAGATGAIGRRLVPLLLRAGHDVTGATRSAEKARELQRVGAAAVVLDVFDAQATRAAMRAAKPEAVIHQLTICRANSMSAASRRPMAPMRASAAKARGI